MHRLPHLEPHKALYYYQMLLEAFDISSTTAGVIPDLLKDLAILSDIQRPADDQKDLKSSLKQEKG